MHIYRFPFEKIGFNKSIVVWGAGLVGKEYIAQLVDIESINVLCVVDTYAKKEILKGIPVKKPDKGMDEIKASDYVIIAVDSEDAILSIKNELLINGIDESKIISSIIKVEFDDECVRDALGIRLDCIDLPDYTNNSFEGPVYLQGVPQFLEDQSMKDFMNDLQRRYVYGNIDNNLRDLSRLHFFSLNVEHILQQVDGDIAELGVYKGDTASVLAVYAEKYNRNIYLFDTFQGFDNRDKVEIDAERVEDFSDTSLQYVKKHVGYDNRVKYIIGYFPESVDGSMEDIEYALVHIDCDLYKPIKDGLEYFYNKLVKKGMIIVHDYSSGRWPGATLAVDDFCLTNNIHSMVLMPDLSGSAIIVKV